MSYWTYNITFRTQTLHMSLYSAIELENYLCKL